MRGMDIPASGNEHAVRPEREDADSLNPEHFIRPAWPLPARVGACVTTRSGGLSQGRYGLAGGGVGGLNLGDHCGDESLAVRCNRERLVRYLPSPPLWLQQVHGSAVVDMDTPRASTAGVLVGDAAVTRVPGRVLAVLSADCLPVLLVDEQARVVGIAHAGWRGLAAGVLENTVGAMRAALGVDAPIVAWLGPAIGPEAFEVGPEVFEAFCAHQPEAACAFRPAGRAGKWMADLYSLARQRLAAVGVDRVGGGALCTVGDPARFYSYRRDGVTGRLASLIWLAP